MKRLLQLAIILGCLPVPALGQWVKANAKDKFVGGGGSSITSPAFTSALSNPSVIFAGCRFGYSITPPVMSVSDCTGSNTYVDSGAGQVHILGAAEYIQLFIARNTSTTASCTVTCTATGGGSVGSLGIEVAEFTGVATSLTIDAFTYDALETQATGGANVLVLPSSGCGFCASAMSTTFNGDLIYAMFGLASAGCCLAGTSPNVFTLVIAAPGSTPSEYFTQTTHGTISPTEGYTGGGTQAWGAIGVAIKPATATSATKIGMPPPMMR